MDIPFVFWIVLFISGVAWLAFIRQPLWIWTVSLSIFMALFTMWSDSSSVAIVILWVLFLPFIFVLNILPFRRSLISRRILALYRSILPKMSETERVALEAGSVWWESELFSGKPDWKKLLELPSPSLNLEEKAFLDGPVEELCKMLDEWQINQLDYDLSTEVWTFLKKKKFFGMIIPKQYGGLGFSAQAHSEVIMKLSSRSPTCAVTAMVPNSLGPGQLILLYGTQEQKKYYLPRLASGKEIPCFALTSPYAGSDAASMIDSGIVCKDKFEGKQNVLGIRLNWDKRYITLAPVATVLGLAFKLYDPEHLLGNREELGITVALIPTHTPGVKTGDRHFPLNQAFQNGPTLGKDVFIPVDWIIGGVEQAGHGWRMLMECLAEGRSISLPALSTGAGKLASRGAGAYGRIRKQFKTPIGRFEGIEEPLAHIGAYTYMMDAARTLTSLAVDQGERPAVVSAIVKYHLTERMRTLVNDAMDIFGGAGICLGPRNLMGRLYQAVPISITVEGANILTRSLIIFGQGAVRNHPYLLEEMKAASNENHDKALEYFDKALFGHIGYAISNKARAFLLAVTGGRLEKVEIDGPGRHYIQQIARMSAAFAFVADVTLATLGGELKRKEKLSARLGDVLAQLYLVSATLKRFEDQGRPTEDADLLSWACEDALYMAQQQLDGLLRNFPNRLIGFALRAIVFPFGKPYLPPSDNLGHRVATFMLKPSPARDRLTAGIYISDDPDEPLGRLEYALNKLAETEEIENKLRKAIRSGDISAGTEAKSIQAGEQADILTHDEADKLRHAVQAAYNAIVVDKFKGNDWQQPISDKEKE
ncbi:MAG: acyl-CoA dehydrogenase [Mariprofundaceae bacterium]